ncbi:MAG: rod shape-determining protein MreD [Bacteroidaceae bacterium]|nr:rod shape-determining protein MreD [Bacteroidaceae bacterium]
MSSLFLMRLCRLFVLLCVQVLILNHVHLLGYLTPLIIGYMMVCFHRGTSRVSALLWGFAIGLIFDMFSNTAGMASASCTLIGLIQPPLCDAFAPRDAAEDFTPSFQTLGFWSYITYVFIIMLVLHGGFYLLDAFTLANWPLTLAAIIGSSFMATLLIMFIELLVRSRK